ncbi:hypothetical protein KIPB_003712 [Kipferlia bialata]|uniref:BEACH domain-containing protein n=1 Tax=Kipferlia bialata TaxID=797122 RepID=A0A9K3CU49_9EUKA|nr:hypothetical protein KIPB_003712 [Kipferlia bialata]|eukprot:g3712.t1
MSASVGMAEVAKAVAAHKEGPVRVIAPFMGESVSGELIPEFFCMPDFLRNHNHTVFGNRQDGQALGDVILPPWAKGSAETFISTNRAALESRHVSAHLHEWIDLIFGVNQSGEGALKACNVYPAYSYEGNVNIDAIKDEHMRNASVMRINEFGQTPAVLFDHPHPCRQTDTLSPSFTLAKPELEEAMMEAYADGDREREMLREREKDSKDTSGRTERERERDNRALVVFNPPLRNGGAVSLHRSPSMVTRFDPLDSPSAVSSPSTTISPYSMTGSPSLAHTSGPDVVAAKKEAARKLIALFGLPSSTAGVTAPNMRMVAIRSDGTLLRLKWQTRAGKAASTVSVKPFSGSLTPDGILSSGGRGSGDVLVDVSSGFGSNISLGNANLGLDPVPMRLTVHKSIPLVGFNILSLSNPNTPVQLCAVRPQGDVVFTGGHFDGSLQANSVESGRLVQAVTRHRDVISCVAVTEDGRYLVTGSKDTTALVWALSPDTGTDGCMVAIRDTKAGVGLSDLSGSPGDSSSQLQPLHVLSGHDQGVVCLDVCSGADLCVTGSLDGTLILTALASGLYIRSIVLPSRHVPVAVRILYNGCIMVHTGQDCTTRLYSVNGTLLHSAVETLPITAVTVSTGGRHVLLAGKRGAVVVRSADTLARVGLSHTKRRDDVITSMAFSLAGQALVVSSARGDVSVFTI